MKNILLASFIAVLLILPGSAYAQVPFGGPILAIIPPNILLPPYCPFFSFVIGPPFPGWYAFDGVGLLAFFDLSPGATLLGIAETEIPCGIVPGVIVYTGTNCWSNPEECLL